MSEMHSMLLFYWEQDDNHLGNFCNGITKKKIDIFLEKENRTEVKLFQDFFLVMNLNYLVVNHQYHESLTPRSKYI